MKKKEPFEDLDKYIKDQKRDIMIAAFIFAVIFFGAIILSL